jgi:hypothetical protein
MRFCRFNIKSEKPGAMTDKIVKSDKMCNLNCGGMKYKLVVERKALSFSAG